jgi:hypothetical protein
LFVLKRSRSNSPIIIDCISAKHNKEPAGWNAKLEKLGVGESDAAKRVRQAVWVMYGMACGRRPPELWKDIAQPDQDWQRLKRNSEGTEQVDQPKLLVRAVCHESARVVTYTPPPITAPFYDPLCQIYSGSDLGPWGALVAAPDIAYHELLLRP